MGQKTKTTYNKLMKSDKLVFTFLRSIVSSQVASWLDLALGFVLFAWAGFSPLFAAGTGAIAGGILNCIINYRFTFHASECPWRAVIVKYALVWIGSVLFNSFGTDILYRILSDWHILDAFNLSEDAIYAAARLVISFLVSCVWNFTLQRSFVYRKRSFDTFAIAFTRFFFPDKKIKLKK